MVKVGVVILNYKTYQDTIRLVNDLLSFKMKDELHIMVVDNCSPNNSYEVLNSELSEKPNVTVIQSKENGGYAKGNNVGLRALKKYYPEYVLILNNDVFFSESTLINCIYWHDHLQNPGIVAPMQYLPTGKPEIFESLQCHSFIEDLCVYSILLSKLKKSHDYVSNTSFENIQEVQIIPGCFLLLKYSTFEEIGFFYEETFLFCEERFLFTELNKKGYKNYIILNQKYIHNHSHTINSEVSREKQKRLLHKGYLLYTNKYRSFPKLKNLLLNLAFFINKYEVRLLSKFKKY